MRHRIKSGKIGSFNPERVEVPEELQEEQALSSEVEEIFEEDTAFSDSDETLAAMELYGRHSHGDRYLGMTAAMTQAPVPAICH